MKKSKYIIYPYKIFSKNDDKYNYILIKQVLHLIPIEQRELLYIELKKIFSNGKIVIMQMNEKFQLPCFPEMKKNTDQIFIST